MKKRKKRHKWKRLIMTLFLVLLTGGAFAVFAANNKVVDSDTASNVVNIGKVKVALSKQPLDQRGKKVTVGDPVSNLIKVTNEGDYAAYVRLELVKEWQVSGYNLTEAEQNLLKPDLIEVVLFDDTNWKQNSTDGKYYYQNILSVTSGSSVVSNSAIFSENYTINTASDATIDSQFNQLLGDIKKKGATLSVNITAKVEAIQASHVDVEKANGYIVGWKDASNSDSNPTVNIDPDATPIGGVDFKAEKIEITNSSASNLIDISNMLPGQTETTYIETKNSSQNTLPIYMYARTEEEFSALGEKQQQLLQQLELTVAKNDGTILYHGPLFENDSEQVMLSPEKPILLGNFAPGQSEKLYVSVSCPSSWAEGDINVKVLWVFASKKAVSNTAAPGGGGSPWRPAPTANTATAVPSPTATAEATEAPATELPSTSEPEVTDMVDVTEEPQFTPTPTEEIIEIEQPTKAPVGPDHEDVTATPVARTATPSKDVETIEEPEEREEPPLPSRDIDKVDSVYPTKTGDATPIILWCGTLLISLVGMTVAMRGWRQRK